MVYLNSVSPKRTIGRFKNLAAAFYPYARYLRGAAPGLAFSCAEGSPTSSDRLLPQPLARVGNQAAGVNDDLPGLGHRLDLELLAAGLVHYRSRR